MITRVSNAVRVQLSKVQGGAVERIRRAMRPRGLSPSWTMYLGKRAGSGLPSLVKEKVSCCSSASSPFSD